MCKFCGVAKPFASFTCGCLSSYLSYLETHFFTPARAVRSFNVESHGKYHTRRNDFHKIADLGYDGFKSSGKPGIQGKRE